MTSIRLALFGDATHVNIKRWSQGLQSAGAEIGTFSLRHQGRAKPLEPVFWLPTIRRLGNLNYFLSVPFARRLLKRWRPDVVLAYYVTGYGTLGRLSGFHPLVQVSSGSDLLHAPRKPMLRWLVKRNLKAADLVVAWAPHMANAARLLGAENVFELAPGIRSQDFRDHHIADPKPDDVLRLIITRSLKADYRLDLVIEVMRVLDERQVPATLTITGNGPERANLEALVDQYGLQERVRLAGFVPNDQLPALLAQHNTYISLVPTDGVSASLLEAMAVGLLPIVPDHPANTNWVTHGENGLLVQDLSPESIATVIQTADHTLRHQVWAQNPAMVSERADITRNGKIFVEQFRQLVERG